MSGARVTEGSHTDLRLTRGTVEDKQIFTEDLTCPFTGTRCSWTLRNGQDMQYERRGMGKHVTSRGKGAEINPGCVKYRSQESHDEDFCRKTIHSIFIML